MERTQHFRGWPPGEAVRFETPDTIVRLRTVEGDPLKRPLVLAPSFGSTLETQRPLAASLHAKDGCSVTAFEIEPTAYTPRRNDGTVPDGIKRNADALTRVIARSMKASGKLVEVVAPSMGAATLLAAFGAHQELTEMLGVAALVSPACVLPKPRGTRIYKAFGKNIVQGTGQFIRHPIERSYLATNTLKSAAVHLRHPRRIYEEASGISRHDESGNLRLMTEAGIPVGIIAFEEDQIFPPKELFDHLEQLGISPPEDSKKIVAGGHTGVGTRSYDDYAEIILGVLSNLRAADRRFA